MAALAGLAITLGATACQRSAPPLLDLDGGPPNVIVLAVDTLRADHLGAYGAEVETPQLDAFAREAIVFERCSSTSSWTLPSFASFFTGLYPYHHGVLGGPYRRLADEATTLAEILHASGYDTRAWVASDYLTPTFNTMQGFDQVEDHFEGPVTGRVARYQPRVVAYLRRPHDQPFFAFAHYFDVHAPYDPPAPFDGMYYQGDPRDARNTSIQVIYDPQRNHLQKDPSTAYPWLHGITDLQYPARQYAAGVTYLDHELAPVFEALRSTGLLDRSIVIVMADHGEHLVEAEHEIYFTHRFPYEECLHVPLIVRLPGALGAGLRVTEDVSLADVLPTLVDLLQLQAPTTDGVSLVPLLRGEQSLDRQYVFAEYGGKDDNVVKAVWDDRHRLLRFTLGERTWEELYDRHEDRPEHHDLSGALPDVQSRLARVLDERFPEGRVLLANPRDADESLDPAVQERLRALGYVD